MTISRLLCSHRYINELNIHRIIDVLVLYLGSFVFSGRASNLLKCTASPALTPSTLRQVFIALPRPPPCRIIIIIIASSFIISGLLIYNSNELNYYLYSVCLVGTPC